MFHYTENNGVNDIVGELGITGTNFGGQGALGRSIFQCAGLLAYGRCVACDANAHVGYGAGGPRHPELAARPAQPEIRRQLSLVHLAHVGSRAKPRLLSVHLRLHDADGDE